MLLLFVKMLLNNLFWKFRICQILFILSVTFFLSLFGQNAFADRKPYYVINETYALSINLFANRYPIIAFLPRRYLVYTENRFLYKKISKRNYVEAITQDGVNVLVLSSDISKSTFNDAFGDSEIIFNAGFQLCKTLACSPDQPEDYLTIRRGDSFKIKSSKQGLLQLAGQDEIVGFVGEAKLEEMIESGQVTRADVVHPRYSIEKQEVSVLSTTCGQPFRWIVGA